MPDGKIAWPAVKDHFRRLWIAYLAGIVILAFFNNLVFTMTRPSFSDDETLKIMLLNADVHIDEQALLEKTRHLGFRAVESVPLAMAADDPTGEMLLAVQLTGGFGDVYITDASGLAALNARRACMPDTLQMENGLHIAAVVNGTTPDSALAALSVIAELIME